MSNAECHLPPVVLSGDTPLKNFDTDLQTFYHEVLRKENGLLNWSKCIEIRGALREVVDAYKKNSACETSFRFDSSLKRYAYVLKHCPCFTSVVAQHFLKLLLKNPKVLQDKVCHDKLNVCCLGGGPGTDAVAIAKVAGLLVNRQTLSFRMTVVDLNEDWKTTAEHVMQTMDADPGFMAFGKTKMSFRYLQADLTQPMDEKVKMVLQNADVVTMVYFLSAVNKGRFNKDALKMVQEIMKHMKRGSVLFFLDSATKVNYTVMETALNILGSSELIYGPFLNEFHTLSLASVKKFLEIYGAHFRNYVCMTNCFVSIAAWLKSEPTPSSRDRFLKSGSCDLRSISDDNRLLKLRQKEWRMTKRMLEFRSKVKKLLTAQLALTHLENETFLEEVEDFEDSLLFDYFDCVPKYFFQTKSKRKRIFTGFPISI